MRIGYQGTAAKSTSERAAVAGPRRSTLTRQRKLPKCRNVSVQSTGRTS